MNTFCILLFFWFTLTLVVSRPSSDDNNSIRIVGGKPARPHKFPYQVVLFTKRGQGGFWCGGTIISPNYILTAAHCLKGARSGIALIGARRCGDFNDRDQLIVELQSSNFIIHESYDNSHPFINDIALIRLPKPLKFNANIQPAQLPQTDIYREGLKVVVSGCGRFSDKSTKGTKVLHYVYLNLISLKECTRTFYLKRPSDYICADGKQRKSTCQGDSGGPMVVNANGVNTIIGVVSFGDEECEKGYPSVYTRVYSYLNWIVKKTQMLH